MTEKLNIIAMRKIFENLSFDDQEAFLYPYISNLQNDLKDAIKIGELLKIECKICKKYKYFHCNETTSEGVKGFKYLDYPEIGTYPGLCENCK